MNICFCFLENTSPSQTSQTEITFYIKPITITPINTIFTFPEEKVTAWCLHIHNANVF